jgi:hypothetical protein
VFVERRGAAMPRCVRMLVDRWSNARAARWVIQVACFESKHFLRDHVWRLKNNSRQKHHNLVGTLLMTRFYCQRQEEGVFIALLPPPECVLKNGFR